MKEGYPDRRFFRMGRNRLAVALFIFHEAQKSRDYLWRQAYQDEALCNVTTVSK